jgi:hypothetical protein
MRQDTSMLSGQYKTTQNLRRHLQRVGACDGAIEAFFDEAVREWRVLG